MAAFQFEGVKMVKAPEHAVPKCPKCEKRLEVVWIKTKGLGLIEQQQLIMCPYCETLLGYGTYST
jgi:hypothetical protein